MLKKIIYTVSVLFFIILIFGAYSLRYRKEEKESAEYLFETTFLKTGESDSIILESQNRTILINTADKESGRKITRFLNSKGIEEVDCIIITDFNDSCIGGFPIVSDRVKIKNVIHPAYKGQGECFENYRKKLSEKNINIICAEKNISFKADDLDFNVYMTKTEFEENSNRSLVTSVTHGGKSFLFTGDINSERVMELLNADIDKYDFVTAPSHGLYFEGLTDFYSAVSPYFTVITDEYNTETDKTEEILHKLKSNIYHTKDGLIKVFSDGITLKALQE